MSVLPPESSAPRGTFTVEVDGERLEIPDRLYNAEPIDADIASLDSIERAILHCLCTRNHDGFVRQRHLETIMPSGLSWVVPYVVALIGEYVIEIIVTILSHLDLDTPGAPDRDLYGRFVAENPAFFETIARRVTSYWNCYYRFDYPVADPLDGRFPRYPGFVLIDKLRVAAAEVEGAEA